MVARLVLCALEVGRLPTCDNRDDCSGKAQCPGPLATQLADEAGQPHCSGALQHLQADAAVSLVDRFEKSPTNCHDSSQGFFA